MEKEELVDQPTARPTRKVQYTAVAGAITWAITAAVGHFFPEAPIPPELTLGIPVAAATLAGYLVRARPGEE